MTKPIEHITPSSPIVKPDLAATVVALHAEVERLRAERGGLQAAVDLAIHVLTDQCPQDSPTATPTTLTMLADDAQERGEHVTAAAIREVQKRAVATLAAADLIDGSDR